MRQGSLPERYLTRSVIKHIQKLNKDIEVGASVGNDYARLDSVVTADGYGETPWIAWVKASNNFYCSGGQISGARVTLMLPADIKESKIKEYMAAFNGFAKQENIQILGGHSQVTDACNRVQFFVTMVGKIGKYMPRKKAIKPGYDIVMTGYAGRMGADVILRTQYDDLKKRFSESFLQQAYMDESEYATKDAARILTADESLDVCYIHDASCGGVYGGLWQLGVWMDKGFEVIHKDMLIRQETIELCEYCNRNPYLVDGCGSLFAVTEKGDKAVEALREAGIAASVIGKVTEKKEKLIIVNDVDKRCLSPVNGDE